MENYLFISLVIAVIWGIIPFFTKYVLHKIHYKSLILIESILAFLIAMTYCCCNHDEIRSDMKNVDLFSIFAMVFIGFAIFSANIMYYSIIKDHPTYLITAITSISPLIAFAISYMFLREKITWCKALGVFLVVGGVFFITR